MGADRPIRSLALALLLLPGCAAADSTGDAGAGESGRVARVSDGDTLRLADGRRVRLVQIDAPEAGHECWGNEATRTLGELAPAGASVELARDPALDDRDRFDRLLRYVRVGGRDVNLVLVERGAAAPYFYRGERGRHAAAFLAAARAARQAGRGLWGACPRARLEPGRALDTGPR